MSTPHPYFKNAYQRGSDIWSHIPHHKRSLAMLKPFLKKEATCLDVGSGRGQWIMKLARLGHRILGIDYLDTLVHELNHQIKQEGYERRARCLFGEATNIPFTDDSFDVITNIGQFQHLKKEDWVPYFNELKRVLKSEACYLNVSLSKRTRRYLGLSPFSSQEQIFEKFDLPFYFLDDQELAHHLKDDFILLDEQYESFASPSDPGDDIVLSFSLFQKK